MINTMEIIAIVAGVLVGLWRYGRQAISWLFIIVYSLAFSSKTSFYELYDRADDELSFEWYKDHNKNIRKYADYLKLHADARSSAFGSFRKTNEALKRSLLFRVIPISLLPAILFWTNWYLYLIGVVVIVVVLVSYELARHGVRPGFYQRLVVFTILSTYAEK